ncbi:MAG: hypothetical protein JNJ58_08290 [Chitinophagaceae bacterium]|nr:hypothetical protein [Chitinophagaceae bacterium]
MKKILSVSVILLLLVVAYSSCKKKTTTNTTKDNIIVDIGYGDTTTLPSTVTMFLPSLVDVNLIDNPVQVDTFATKVDEFIGPYGFTKDQIIKVNLKELKIRIEDPGTTQYFNFVKDTTPVSIKIFVDSFGGTTPKMVAFKNSVPRDLQELVLDVSADDIKDYFRSEYMKVMIAFCIKKNESLSSTAKFRFNFTFTVTAAP